MIYSVYDHIYNFWKLSKIITKEIKLILFKYFREPFFI